MRRLSGALVVAVLTAGASTLSPTAGAKVPGQNGQIVFARFDPTVDDSRVFTVNPDGSEEHQLFDGIAEVPRWSPDGTQIAMICCQTNLAPTIINADGSGLRQLTIPIPQNGFNVWSADGSRLAGAVTSDVQPQLDGAYTLRSSDGGDFFRVTTAPGEDDPADYSPDGRRMVLVRHDPTRPQNAQNAVFVVNIDGTGFRRLTPWGLGASGLSWSPNGKWILFASNGFIWVVHPDGSGLQQIRIDTGSPFYFAEDPVWSPEGKRIALSLFLPANGHLDIYTMGADGRNLVQVTHSPTGDEVPDWGTHPLAG